LTVGCRFVTFFTGGGFVGSTKCSIASWLWTSAGRFSAS